MYIRYDRLEEQMLAPIISNMLSPEALEYAIAALQLRLQEQLKADSLARKADPKNLSSQLTSLHLEAENLTDAIAAGGHRKSPTLLSRLADLELQIEDVERRIEESKQPEPEPVSPERIRNIVKQKAEDLRQVLLRDRERAKHVLRQHLGELVLTPHNSPEGRYYTATGNMDLFGGDGGVLLCNPSPGHHSTILVSNYI